VKGRPLGGPKRLVYSQRPQFPVRPSVRGSPNRSKVRRRPVPTPLASALTKQVLPPHTPTHLALVGRAEQAAVRRHLPRIYPHHARSLQSALHEHLANVISHLAAVCV
jgi:hypothetical protein